VQTAIDGRLTRLQADPWTGPGGYLLRVELDQAAGTLARMEASTCAS
jgi:hypothetical protein